MKSLVQSAQDVRPGQRLTYQKDNDPMHSQDNTRQHSLGTPAEKNGRKFPNLGVQSLLQGQEDLRL